LTGSGSANSRNRFRYRTGEHALPCTMPTNASPTWPHLSLIRTVIANRVETAFADNQDLHEPGVFFSRDRVLNVPPLRGAVRGQHSLSISIYRFWFFGFQL